MNVQLTVFPFSSKSFKGLKNVNFMYANKKKWQKNRMIRFLQKIFVFLKSRQFLNFQTGLDRAYDENSRYQSSRWGRIGRNVLIPPSSSKSTLTVFCRWFCNKRKTDVEHFFLKCYYNCSVGCLGTLTMKHAPRSVFFALIYPCMFFSIMFLDM